MGLREPMRPIQEQPPFPKTIKRSHNEAIDVSGNVQSQVPPSDKQLHESLEECSQDGLVQNNPKQSRSGFPDPSFYDNQFDSNDNPTVRVESAHSERPLKFNIDEIVSQCAVSESAYSESHVSIFTVEDRGHTALMDQEAFESNDVPCEHKGTLQVPTLKKSWSSPQLKPGAVAQWQETPETSFMHMPSTSITDLSASGSIKRPECTSEELIGDEIRKRSIMAAPDGKYFLPYDELRRIMTRSNVATLLREAFPHYETRRIRTLIGHVIGDKNDEYSGKRPPRRKIIAILVMMEQITRIESFIEDDINDGHLPLDIERNSHSKKLVRFCRRQTSSSKSVSIKPLNRLNEWPSKDVEDFFHRQESVCAPFFELPGDRVCFYNLQANAILPYLSHEEICVGGYSSVRQVEIHRSHYSHGNSRKAQEGTRKYFAVKELHPNNEDAYRREVELFEKIGVGKKDHAPEHLIQLQLTYRHGNHYFLVFPWADGNLQEFWEKRSHFSPRNPGHTKWFFSQCLGLAKALRRIHHFSTISDPGNGTQDLDDLNSLLGEKNWGRHGDIKPENILWFEKHDEKDDYLVISDFGLTSFNTAHSRSKVAHDAITGYTGTYRPPEVDLRHEISQRYDIWSLGCVYLEFVSWFLVGHQETHDTFSSQRAKEERGKSIQEDTFYILDSAPALSGKITGAQVKQSVNTWIDKLHRQKNCTQPLHGLLDLIQSRMLVVTPKDRWDCKRVSMELYHLLGKCKVDSYATKGVPYAANLNQATSTNSNAKSRLPIFSKKSTYRSAKNGAHHNIEVTNGTDTRRTMASLDMVSTQCPKPAESTPRVSRRSPAKPKCQICALAKTPTVLPRPAATWQSWRARRYVCGRKHFRLSTASTLVASDNTPEEPSGPSSLNTPHSHSIDKKSQVIGFGSQFEQSPIHRSRRASITE